jgi:hypothetical protein
MIWRGLALAVAALLLCGCETERHGLDYSAMTQKVGPPRAGLSRIVVLREKGYAGISDPGWDVRLDGGPMSDLKTGTYVYSDRAAGQHQLSATAALFPGVSQQDISTLSGRTYFFLVRPSERSKVLAGMSAAAGWPVCWSGPPLLPATVIPGRSISFPWKRSLHGKRSPSCDWRNSVRSGRDQVDVGHGRRSGAIARRGRRNRKGPFGDERALRVALACQRPAPTLTVTSFRCSARRSGCGRTPRSSAAVPWSCLP